VAADPGTEVLGVYSGGTPDAPLPAITSRPVGKGRAILVPRVRLWPGHLDALRGARLSRPELRALKLPAIELSQPASS